MVACITWLDRIAHRELGHNFLQLSREGYERSLDIASIDARFHQPLVEAIRFDLIELSIHMICIENSSTFLSLALLRTLLVEMHQRLKTLHIPLLLVDFGL